MSGELISGGHVLELQGKDALLEGYERILYDHSLHLVVIRGLVSQSELGVLQDSKWHYDEAVEQVFPMAADITALMSVWWQEYGFNEYQLVPRLQPANYRAPNVGTRAHIDSRKAGEHGGLRVGASLSVAGGENGAEGLFLARRLRAVTRLPDGELDEALWKKWQNRAGFVRCPARVKQFPTDGVLLANLPSLTVHKLVSRGGRWGRLLDYIASSNSEAGPPQLQEELAQAA